MEEIRKCIVCERNADAINASNSDTKFTCLACGTYIATRAFQSDTHHHIKLHTPRAITIIGHWLWRSQQSGVTPRLENVERLEALVEQDWLPSHSMQADNLIRYIGQSAALGEHADLSDESVQFIIGTETQNGVPFLARELAQRGLCDFQTILARLTLDGWNLYDELKRGLVSGNKAFMAMPFNTDLDTTILPCAKSAAKSCGFRLDRVDDQPKPGIIDVQIRVAIQEARFAIVDLTYENLGAYWEAGFAEGMGKPVIYTVRADHDASVHFDTAHLSRVIWEEDKLDIAGKQIKAMIRNELPDAIHDD